ncbi:epimerase [Pseudoalteromonas sp. B137]
MINKLHKLCLGDNEGNYRIGSNTFFTNDAGESKVSFTDYATAMVDVAQKGVYVNQHISIAY